MTKYRATDELLNLWTTRSSAAGVRCLTLGGRFTLLPSDPDPYNTFDGTLETLNVTVGHLADTYIHRSYFSRTPNLKHLKYGWSPTDMAKKSTSCLLSHTVRTDNQTVYWDLPLMSASILLDLSALRALETLTITLVAGHTYETLDGPWNAALSSLPSLNPSSALQYLRLRILVDNYAPNSEVAILDAVRSRMAEMDLLLASFVKAGAVHKVQIGLYGSVAWGTDTIYQIASRDLLYPNFPELRAIGAFELLT